MEKYSRERKQSDIGHYERQLHLCAIDLMLDFQADVLKVVELF